jgi:enediyne biosynthesis protein E4
MDKPNFSITLKMLTFAAIAALSLTATLCQAGEADFNNVTSALGLTPGGQQASWGDYNNNGWVDLYSSGGTYNSGTLWHNDGKTGGTHNGFTEKSGPNGNGGMWGDYDNDGYLDMFCAGKDTWSLWHNNSGTSWTKTSGMIPDEDPWTDWKATGSTSCWVDINKDSYLDVYATGNETTTLVGLQDVLLTSNNATSFTQTMQPSTSYARGVTACDFDEDGDQDIYVSRYRLEANILWLNNGTGGFSNTAAAAGVDGYGHTMGSAWGDMDNDGHFDLLVGNLSHNPSQDPVSFFRNRGPNNPNPADDWHFELKYELSGTEWQDSFSTPALGDYDNDGDLDAYITTVYEGDSPRLYRNNGDWTFTNVTAAEGLGSVVGTYQAAWGDYDNDGDLDLATEGSLFRNNLSNSNHWLKVKLKAPADSNTINAAAIGAQARILLDTGKTVTRQVEGATGQGNQNQLTLHFGLGAQTTPVDIVVTWPDGTTQTEEDVSVDQLVTITAMVYKSGDIHKDGYVNTKDLAKMLKDWLKCNDPNNEDCEIIAP